MSTSKPKLPAHLAGEEPKRPDPEFRFFGLSNAPEAAEAAEAAEAVEADRAEAGRAEGPTEPIGTPWVPPSLEEMETEPPAPSRPRIVGDHALAVGEPMDIAPVVFGDGPPQAAIWDPQVGVVPQPDLVSPRRVPTRLVNRSHRPVRPRPEAAASSSEGPADRVPEPEPTAPSDPAPATTSPEPAAPAGPGSPAFDAAVEAAVAERLEAVRAQAFAEAEAQAAPEVARRVGAARAEAEAAHAEVVASLEADLAEARGPLERAAERLQAAAVELQQRLGEDLVALASKLAGRVLEHEALLDMSLLERHVREALRLAGAVESVTLRCHPDDAGRLRELAPALATQTSGRSVEVLVQTSPDVERGGVIALFDEGIVDVRIANVLGHLSQAIDPVIREHYASALVGDAAAAQAAAADLQGFVGGPESRPAAWGDRPTSRPLAATRDSAPAPSASGSEPSTHAPAPSLDASPAGPARPAAEAGGPAGDGRLDLPDSVPPGVLADGEGTEPSTWVDAPAPELVAPTELGTAPDEDTDELREQPPRFGPPLDDPAEDDGGKA